MVHLLTLGELRLEEAEDSTLSSRRKELVLLAYLARRGPRPLTRAEAAALLWPDRDERRARQSLRQALLELRQVVGDGLVAESDLIQLKSGSVHLDANAFERELDEGKLETAVFRWAGDFLPGAEEIGGEELRGWLEAERERLRRRLGLALAELAEDAQRNGDSRRAIEWAERWTSALPLDQQGHLRLLRLLHLQGRSAEGLSRYAALKVQLRGLEIDPEPELVQLARQLEDGADASRRSRALSTALRTPDMVGRGPAMSELEAAWHRVVAGAGAAIAVEGEIGIGKTRLCQEFLRRLEESGGKQVIARARAREGSGVPELGVIAQLASGIADAAGLPGAPAASLAMLGAVAPSVATRFPDLALTPVTPERLAAGFRDAVAAVAEETPAVLLVDDLARADPATRRAVVSLMEQPPARVLVVAAVRTGDDEPAMAVPDSSTIRRLKLQPLTGEEVELVLASILELPPADRHHLASRLHEHGGGNPFCVIELVSALAEDGTLIPDDRGTWRLVERDGLLPLPTSVRDVIARRLARLTPPGQKAIEAAAVLAFPFDRGLLAEVAGDSPVTVEAGLDELLAHRLIREGDRDGEYEFVHEMVRRHVERNVPVARSEALSSRASEALRRRVGGGPEYAAAAQHHRVRAARVTAATRRRRAGGLAAAAVLLAGVGGAIALQHGAAPSSTASLAVLPFAVNGAPELGYLRDGMTSLLSTQLDGAGALRAVDPRAVLGIASQVGGAVPAVELGRRVAERVGAGTYVVGDIVEAGGRIRIAAAAYRVGDPGQPIARADVEGNTSHLFELVDAVAGRLLTGLNPGPYEQLTKVAATTTGSLPALKAYLDGERLFRQGNFLPAARAFQRAVVEDSTFGLAYYWLSVTSWWADDSEAIDSAAALAVRYGTRLPERYQRLFQAWEAFLRGDAIEAERIYRRIVELEPENVEAWLQLGEVRFHSGPRRGYPISAARPAFERVLFYEPEHTSAILHLARIAGNEGRLPALDSLVRRTLSLSPAGEWGVEARALRSFATGDVGEQQRVIAELRTAGEGRVWNIARYLAIAVHSLDGAQRVVTLITEPTRPAEVRAFGHLALAHLELARGRARAAAVQIERAAALDPLPALEHRALLALVPFLPTDSADLLALRDSLGRVGSPATPASLETSHLANLHDAVHPELRAYLAAGLSIRLRDTVAARRFLRELETGHRTSTPAAVAADAARSVRAQLAFLAGRTPDAARDLAEVLRLEARVGLIGGSPFYSQGLERFLYGGVLADEGRLQEAATWYDSFSSNSIFDLIYLAPAHLERGRLAERLSQPKVALHHYEQVVALYLGCDPELRRIPDQARARIAALRAAETETAAR